MSTKKSFKQLSVAQRNEAIQNARVTVADFDSSKIPQVDVLKKLEQTCGPYFQYNSHSYGVAWPQVTCQYRPDDGSFGGFSRKFKCSFEDSTAKDGRRTHKVKYAGYKGPDSSEVIETTLATQATDLIGFHTEIYCPAQISCDDCPSQDPWKNNRAAASPARGRTAQFSWALVEKPLAGFNMANRDDDSPQSQGLEWNELKQVPKEDPKLARELLIEREAWILWMNFLMVLDAGHFNQRIFCLEVDKTRGGPVKCSKPVVYTHDYGHSFYGHFEFKKWAAKSVFKEVTADGCRGNLQVSDMEPKSWPFGIVFAPLISSEARDLLWDRLSRVTDEQWTLIFQLARAEEASRVKSRDFLNVIKRKIDELKQAQCLPFDSGKSVLATPL